MIRSIKPDDIAAVAKIYNYYISNTVVSFEEEPVAINDMQTRVDDVLSTDFPWLVAIQDGEVLGYAYAARWNGRAAYKHTAEVTVYLSQSSTSMGWGTKLYEALFNELKKKSIHSVIGGIALPNAASVGLHEKFGMEQVAQYKEVGFKFNEWIDVGYWQAALKDVSLIINN